MTIDECRALFVVCCSSDQRPLSGVYAFFSLNPMKTNLLSSYQGKPVQHPSVLHLTTIITNKPPVAVLQFNGSYNSLTLPYDWNYIITHTIPDSFVIYVRRSSILARRLYQMVDILVHSYITTTNTPTNIILSIFGPHFD